MDDKKLVKALRSCAKDDCSRCPMTGTDCVQDLQRMAADRLEQLTPPCKIGDKVWALMQRNTGLVPHHGVVTEMYYTDDGRLGIVVKRCCRGEFGKVVFWTKKEAEAAIKKIKEDRNGKTDRTPGQ